MSNLAVNLAAKDSTPSVHLTMGNPGKATADVNKPTNYLMSKEQYALSYNRDKGTPNWVSWHLQDTDLGSVKRGNDFRPDTTLPKGWYQVKPSDYSGSGYDRGHMSPSADRTNTQSNNSATFLMTNMVPQTADNNQHTWAGLENYCRDLVKQGNELYITSGVLGEKEKIGNGKVTVPNATWKVIMVMPKGENDIARVNDKTRTIAVIVPNEQGIDSDWRKFRVSVNDVQKATGLDFFSNVPQAIQDKIEAKVDKP